MSVIHLPEQITHSALITALFDGGAFASDWEGLDINLPEPCFVDQAAIGFLCEWGMVQNQAGKKLGFYGNLGTLRYISRLDLFRHVGFEFEEHFERQSETGRFIPAKLITDDDSVLAAGDDICDLVLHQFDNANEFLPAMEWAVYEIIDNIRLHSETPVPGVVTAQYYPYRHRLDIAIIDYGRGILASLSESRQLWSHGDAISKALQRGVTRDQEVGQGNGMAGTSDIVRLNGGEMHVWTGDADFTINSGKDKGFKLMPEVSGSGVFIRLDTRRPVRLSDTFISDPGWSYINFEAERLVDTGGIRIASECVHTGGREPAGALRRKIEALLPEMQDPLILDFDGITIATSSFFDEFLGRLALSLGQEQFQRQVRAINLNDDLRAIANVAIRQRLEST